MHATHDKLANAIAKILTDKGLLDPQNYTYDDLKALLSELLVGFGRNV